jgi:two-component system, sensor histidine kinase and response regulator
MLPSVSAAIVAGAPDAVLVIDEDGRYQDANPAACQLLGYSREELLHLRSDDVIPKDAPWVEEARARYRAEGRWHGEIELVGKDGALVPLEAWSVPIPSPDGPRYVSFLRDLRDRNRREAAEARLAALVQASVDAIISVSTEGIITEWNPAAARLYGYPAEEAIGQPVSMLTPPERTHEVAQFLARIRAGEPINGAEIVRQTKDGRLIEVLLTAAPIKDAAGTIIGTASIARDITGRRRMEEELRQSEERFRSAFDHAGTGMALIADDGRLLEVNPRLCTMLATSEAELLHSSSAEITIAEDRNLDGDLVQQLLRGEIASYQVEKRLVRKPDEVIWGRLTVSLVRGATHEPLYFVVQIQDVTPFKAAGAALRESEERFHRAFDHAPIGMALVASDGRFLQVNRALCQLVGYPEEELLGTSFPAITHPDDVASALEQATRLWAGEIETYQLEQRYLHKDDRVVWVLFTGSVVRDASGPKYSIAQILDITGRRHLEMDRAILLASEREYYRQLQALTEMRADFTAMIAHELGNPVSALRMMTAVVKTGELSAQDEAEMLTTMEGEIEQLDRLISDVVAITVAEREDFSVQQHPISLRDLLEHAATLARTSLGDHPFAMSDVPDVRVECDPERMSQVLRNLLDNAAKHTPPGTPIELRAHHTGKHVRIEVADQGPGVPKEDVAVVFEKFGRGHRSAAQQTPGAGLGLYLSRQIVQAHGSELRVASVPGGETIFAFDLQVAP